jgi:tripartite-type tricarboxylate transporter receptor subunit TctC
MGWILLSVILVGPGLSRGVTASDPVCTELQGERIRWIVPSRAGGGYDRYSRLIQPFLEQRLEADIVIDNRPEAGGIVGAMAIRDAGPDGRTLGVINASGLLAAAATREVQVPDPSRDFTVLAKVVSNRMFVFTGRDSGFESIHDLVEHSTQYPVLAGIRDVGSASFLALPITASLIDLNFVTVTGYVGSTNRVLALIRGEIDLIIQNFDSVRPYVDSGELLPLLDVTGAGATGPANRLGGPSGLAAKTAMKNQRPVQEAVRKAAALSAIVSAGRLVVAPGKLPQPLGDCLQTHLMNMLTSEAFLNAAGKAGLTIDAADAESAQSDLEASRDSLAEFNRLVQKQIDQVRR